MKMYSATVATTAVAVAILCGCSHTPRALPSYDACLQLSSPGESTANGDLPKLSQNRLKTAQSAGSSPLLPQPQPASVNPQANPSMHKELEKLNKLREIGFISEAEYQRRKNELKTQNQERQTK